MNLIRQLLTKVLANRLRPASKPCKYWNSVFTLLTVSMQHSNVLFSHLGLKGKMTILWFLTLLGELELKLVVNKKTEYVTIMIESKQNYKVYVHVPIFGRADVTEQGNYL